MTLDKAHVLLTLGQHTWTLPQASKHGHFPQIHLLLLLPLQILSSLFFCTQQRPFLSHNVLCKSMQNVNFLEHIYYLRWRVIIFLHSTDLENLLSNAQLPWKDQAYSVRSAVSAGLHTAGLKRFFVLHFLKTHLFCFLIARPQNNKC